MVDMRNEILAELERQQVAELFGLTDFQANQLAAYAELLVETNKVMNLTAITDARAVVQLHFIDSFTLLKELDEYLALNPDITTVRMADVGTGAGFPGIPVKIMRPQINLTLIDSLAKRVNFLTNVCQEIGLTSTETLHLRAEDAGQDATLRERFDITTARAVAKTAVLSEYCLPLNKVGGVFLMMKGDDEADIDDGRRAIGQLGGKIIGIRNFLLPDSEVRRTIVTIKKVKQTPKAFPRKSGTPKKKPL